MTANFNKKFILDVTTGLGYGLYYLPVVGSNPSSNLLTMGIPSCLRQSRRI